MKSLILTLIFIFLTTVISLAQSITPEVISSGGGYYTNQYASICLTIGEPVIETISNDSLTLTQGFQQGDWEITAITEVKMPCIEVLLYPNPAKDYISLIIRYDGAEFFTMEMCDADGKTLVTAGLKQNDIQSIDMLGYAPGQYFIKISCLNSGYSKTYKIVKR
ncbi:MAG: T9SS type A sorting domain-containing protein [Bacteroidia bacterium]|nr:T9SS type A sorting domain-containing protein [Bacteroidia bacterium]